MVLRNANQSGNGAGSLSENFTHYQWSIGKTRLGRQKSMAARRLHISQAFPESEASMKRFYQFVAVAVGAGALMLSAAPAQATPVAWQFDSAAAFGGTISGSFVYDVDLDLYSDVSVSTSGGTLPTQTFLYDITAVPGPSVLEFAPTNGDLTNVQILVVNLATVMTNAGGTLGIDAVQLYTCLNATCTTVGSGTTDNDARGSIVGSPVPEPLSAVVLGTGLLGLGVLRRPRRRA